MTAREWVERNKLFVRGTLDQLADGKLVDLARAHRAELGCALKHVDVCNDCRRPATVLFAVTRTSGEVMACWRCLDAAPPEAMQVEIRPERRKAA